MELKVQTSVLDFRNYTVPFIFPAHGDLKAGLAEGSKKIIGGKKERDTNTAKC